MPEDVCDITLAKVPVLAIGCCSAMPCATRCPRRPSIGAWILPARHTPAQMAVGVPF